MRQSAGKSPIAKGGVADANMPLVYPRKQSSMKINPEELKSFLTYVGDKAVALSVTSINEVLKQLLLMNESAAANMLEILYSNHQITDPRYGVAQYFKRGCLFGNSGHKFFFFSNIFLNICERKQS
jgi:hypothetical protein